MRFLTRTALFILFLVPIHDEAAACSCAPVTPQQAFEQADSVFTAVIETIRPFSIRWGPLKGQVTLKVLKVWKGNPGKIAVIQTGGQCDVSWHIGKGEVLVYARYARTSDPENPDKVFRTDICSRTANVRLAAVDLEFLGPGKNP